MRKKMQDNFRSRSTCSFAACAPAIRSPRLDLLTVEMPDPIGSQFGIVVDEVTYGADLRDALTAMADRWDLEDMRMFVVSLRFRARRRQLGRDSRKSQSGYSRAASMMLKVGRCRAKGE
jgi:tight adherence protein B